MAKTLNQKNHCTIYLVRHGETDHNKTGILQGARVDPPLNRLGEQQARAAAQRLKQVPFAAAFSSNLVRAQKTAEIISLEHHLTVITKKALRERSFGKFEGRPQTELKEELKSLLDKYAALADKEKFKFKFPYGIENADAAAIRLIAFLRQISVAYLNKTVLVVSHGSVMRALLIRLGYASYDQLPTYPFCITNLGYIVLESDGVDFFVKETFGIKVNL